RPGSETSCERRDETTVTPQAFALFNSSFAHDRARALSARVAKQAGDVEGQVRLAFRLSHGRGPDREELTDCAAHGRRRTAHHRAHAPARDELPTRVRRKMVEEMTGEEYEWEEELDGMHGYRRDLQAWQVGPQTRALADLCLVLLNSNEFLYLR